MRQVWIGCSRVLHAEELIRRYIDPFYKVLAAFLDLEKHAGEVPELVRSFGAGRDRSWRFRGPRPRGCGGVRPRILCEVQTVS
jgi:hypothetical protein